MIAWLENRLMELGAKVSRLSVPGSPEAILGEFVGADRAATLMIYDHYDVQPVDPLNLWISPPFEPADPGRQALRPGRRRQQG